MIELIFVKMLQQLACERYLLIEPRGNEPNVFLT